MNVLVVGSGGREHALAWKLAQSPRVTRVYCAPGNGGTAALGTNVPIAANDLDGIVNWASENSVNLVVVGPEDPLAAGLVDRLTTRGIPAFGPTQAAARIESSKDWAKALMRKQGIPTAQSASFDDPEAAKAYVREQCGPVVVKADGLAAGKGVVVAEDAAGALEAIDALMVQRVHGAAGARVLVEERLTGTEVSLLVVTDGQTIRPMLPACDYKRVFDDDAGPNTGGMGSYAPPRFVTPELLREIERKIIVPAVEGLAAAGAPYRGVLYAGLMITDDGPKVIEFNSRFGDPETQSILPLLETDLFEVMLATVEGRLDEIALLWRSQAACGVALTSGGYPGKYQTGFPITGLDNVERDVVVFHAGTRREADGRIVTAGGRVLNVVGIGATMAAARAAAYRQVERIHFEGMHYRRDIALREVE